MNRATGLLGDCPECGALRTVEGGVCEVCLAELGEHGGEAADLPPAVTSAELRFADLMAELHALVDRAADAT